MNQRLRHLLSHGAFLVLFTLTACLPEPQFGDGVVLEEDFFGPAIELISPASSPGSDATPTLRVTLEDRLEFSEDDIISIHEGVLCAGSAITTFNVTQIEDGDIAVDVVLDALLEGPYTFSARVTFNDGSGTLCSLTAEFEELRSVDYDYEAADPQPTPVIALHADNDNDVNTVDTPKFVVTLSDASSFVAADVVTIHQAPDCSDAEIGNATADGATGVDIEVTLTNALPEGTDTFYAQYTRGAESFCSAEGVDYRYLDFNLANSTIAIDTATVSEGGTATVTITVKNSADAVNTNATGLNIEAQLDEASAVSPSMGTFGPAAEVLGSPGVYEIEFTADSAGAGEPTEILGFIEGQQMTNTTSVEVVP